MKPSADESYFLIINSYSESEVWAGNLQNLITQYTIANEKNLRVEYLNMLLIDSKEKLLQKQNEIFSKYPNPPSGVIFLGGDAWGLMKDSMKVRYKDCPMLICSSQEQISCEMTYILKSEQPD
ncbi:MAG: hypothetical protein RRZ65_10095, partial [Tannerellaceae bacterium]